MPKNSTINILIIDDDPDNIITIKSGLKNFFADKCIFPSNDEHKGFSKKISRDAENNNITELAGWINEYIVKYNIDLIILDLALTQKEHKKDVEDSSGIGLINSFVSDYTKNEYLKYIPVVVFSFMDIEQITNKTKANTIHSMKKPTMTSDNMKDLLKKNNQEIVSILQKHAEKYKWLKDNQCFKNNTGFDYDLAIVCALKKEFKYIKKLSDNWSEVVVNGKTYYKALFEGKSKNISVIAKTEDDMGMPEAATLATQMITYFKPQYIAMTGIAAGIKDEDIELGDILIPKMVWNWQSGKFKVDGNNSYFDRDYKKLPLDDHLSDAVGKLESDDDFLSKLLPKYKKTIDTTSNLSVSPRVIVDNMVSGSAVVADSEIVKTEIKSRKLVGIDMEAYGVFYAAKKATKNGAEAIVIKSVCDFADSEKDDRFQDFSAFASAQCLYQLFTKHVIWDIT